MAADKIKDLANTSLAMTEIFRMMQYLAEQNTHANRIQCEDPVTEEEANKPAEKILMKLDKIYHTLLDAAYSEALELNPSEVK